MYVCTIIYTYLHKFVYICLYVYISTVREEEIWIKIITTADFQTKFWSQSTLSSMKNAVSSLRFSVLQYAV